MSDQIDPRASAAESMSKGVSTAAKSFQGFAGEVERMSKATMDHTSETVEKLRGAKSVEEVVSIQTSYMQQSFANYADFARRFGELMMAMPMEFARYGRTAFHEGTESVSKATRQASEQFNQHQG